MATLSQIMDGLAELVSGDLTQNAYAWPVESITVPAVVVGYPDLVDFDLAFQDGGNTYTIPAWFVIGKTASKASRDALSAAMTGVASVKATLDGPQSFGSVRVTDATIEEIAIGTIAYIAIKYTIEVI